MEYTNSRGWLNRRRAADARRDEQADEGRAEVRRIRAALYQAEADANEVAMATQRATLEAERCACPACAGTGLVTVEIAASLLESWHRYKEQGYRPSRQTVAALADIAHGRPSAPGAVVVTATYGMTLPRPGMVHSAEPVADAVEVLKPVKIGKPQKPVEDDSCYLADGALIEV